MQNYRVMSSAGIRLSTESIRPPFHRIVLALGKPCCYLSHPHLDLQVDNYMVLALIVFQEASADVEQRHLEAGTSWPSRPKTSYSQSFA